MSAIATRPATLLAAGLLLAVLHCRSAPAATGLSHGLSIGDVRSDRAILWARANGRGEIRVALRRAEAPNGEPPRLFSALADAEHDYSVRIALDGLQPDREYRAVVWIAADGAPSSGEPPAGVRPESIAFRSAPGKQQAAPLRFVYSGDICGQNVCRDQVEGIPGFAAMRRQKPDFFLALGDLIYADDVCTETGRYGNSQLPGRGAAAVSLAEYRAVWSYVRADREYREFLSQVPVYAVWDDHEVRNDFGPHDAGADFGPYPPEAADAALLPFGLRSFLEWNPLETQPGAPQRIYRSFRYGKNVELFILDTRQYRSLNREADHNLNKSMLGEEQRRWLLEGLKGSDAVWKIVVSSVPISVPTGSRADERGHDGWADRDSGKGFEGELALILRELADAGLGNLLWLTTDVHFATVFRYQPFVDRPRFIFHEAAVGPLQAGLFPNRDFDRSFRPERLFFLGPESPDSVQRFAEAKRFFNYGVIEINARGQLNLSVHAVEGGERYRLRLQPVITGGAPGVR